MSTCRYFCCNQPREEEPLAQMEAFWYTYQYLLELRCVIASEGSTIYQHCSINFKICNDCYGCMTDEQKENYAIIYSHHLVHRDSVYNQMNCTGCNKTLIQVKPAEECLGCMEEFQQADQMLLNLGWGIPVVTAWV